jgi:hypothetical protein
MVTEAGAPRHPAGLCGSCKRHRVVGNRTGSRFYLCDRSRTDPRYPKYPPLPRLECEGYEPGGEDPWDKIADE